MTLAADLALCGVFCAGVLVALPFLIAGGIGMGVYEWIKQQ